MTTEYTCSYCRYEHHDECDDRACYCCYGEPATPPQNLVVICARTYQDAKEFADKRRWPAKNWIFPGCPSSLRGRTVERHVVLMGFKSRPDADAVLNRVEEAERAWRERGATALALFKSGIVAPDKIKPWGDGNAESAASPL